MVSFSLFESQVWRDLAFLSFSILELLSRIRLKSASWIVPLYLNWTRDLFLGKKINLLVCKHTTSISYISSAVTTSVVYGCGCPRVLQKFSASWIVPLYLNWTRPKLCVKKMNLPRSWSFLFRFPIFTVSFWRALYLLISLRRCSFLRWYGVGRRDRQWWYW